MSKVIKDVKCRPDSCQMESPMICGIFLSQSIKCRKSFYKDELNIAK